MSRASIKSIYLDNAASTPVNPKVKRVMADAAELYGNPSSFNDAGRTAGKNLSQARLSIARFLGSRSEEIIFTSSGSEANSLALIGLAEAYPDKKEIVTTPIEHPSVLNAIKVLEGRGFKIKFLRVNRDGLIDTDDLKNKITEKTLLVSVMYANNEIGTIEPIKKISKAIHDFKVINKSVYPFFHTDACQATEYLDMNVNNLGVDLLTFNGSKIYGPRGIAVLYKKRGIALRPLIYGGDQEYGLRAGTENLPAIMGLAKAVVLVDKKAGQRLFKLRDYFFDKLSDLIAGVKINGPGGFNRLPNNINISISGLDDENLLLELDRYGIQASSGSACTARSVEPSHVLKAIGVSPEYISGALRFSMGRQTSKKDLDYVLKILPQAVSDIRKRYLKT